MLEQYDLGKMLLHFVLGTIFVGLITWGYIEPLLGSAAIIIPLIAGVIIAFLTGKKE